MESPNIASSENLRQLLKVCGDLKLYGSYGREKFTYLWHLVDRFTDCVVPHDIRKAYPNLYDKVLCLAMSLWIYDSSYDSAYDVLKQEHLRRIEHAYHVHLEPGTFPSSFAEYTAIVQENSSIYHLCQQEDTHRKKPFQKNAVSHGETHHEHEEMNKQEVNDAVRFRGQKALSNGGDLSDRDAIDYNSVGRYITDVEEALDLIYTRTLIQSSESLAKQHPSTWLYFNYWMAGMVCAGSRTPHHSLTSMEKFYEFRLKDSAVLTLTALYALEMGIDVDTLSEEHLEMWTNSAFHVAFRNDLLSFPRDVRDNIPNLVVMVRKFDKSISSYYDAFQKSRQILQELYDSVMNSPILDTPARNITLGIIQWENVEPRYASGYQLLRACEKENREEFDTLLKKYFDPTMTYEGDFNPLDRTVAQSNK